LGIPELILSLPLAAPILQKMRLSKLGHKFKNPQALRRLGQAASSFEQSWRAFWIGSLDFARQVLEESRQLSGPVHPLDSSFQ